MSKLVIWNPSASRAVGAQGVREDIERDPSVALHETSSHQEAVELARSADCDELIVAGGDGTVNSVINGLAQNPRDMPLAILPLGTGNDLCRSLCVSLDPATALLALPHAVNQQMDIVRIAAENASGDHTEMYFANVASGGNSQRVQELVSSEVKATWGAWSYLRCALPVLQDLRAFEVQLQLDDEPEETMHIWNVIFANGRTVAGGLPVDPRAQLNDGLLDVIIVLDGTPLDTAALTAEFFLGDYLEDKRVSFRQARRVRITSDPPLQILADGEALCGDSFELKIVPEAITVAVDPTCEAFVTDKSRT